MANFQALDAASNTKYLKATGDGTDLDPQVIHRNIDAVIPGTGATNLGKAEDAAHTTGDTGVLVFAVRKDTAAALAGTDGDYAPLEVDETGCLHVITRETTLISQTPTITAGAYSAKDAVGGLLTFANAARVSGGCGRINTITVIDLGDVKADMELWLFDRSFTATSDNAAFDPSDADLANCIGVILIPTANYFSANDNGVGVVRDVNFDYKLNATSLYGQLKCTATPTFAETGGLTIRLAVEYTN